MLTRGPTGGAPGSAPAGLFQLRALRYTYAEVHVRQVGSSPHTHLLLATGKFQSPRPSAQPTPSATIPSQAFPPKHLWMLPRGLAGGAPGSAPAGLFQLRALRYTWLRQLGNGLGQGLTDKQGEERHLYSWWGGGGREGCKG